MEKSIDLKVLQDIYDHNGNLMEYLRRQNNTESNTAEYIMLSYDFQTGTSTESYYRDPGARQRFLRRLSDIVAKKDISGSILDAGTGEATSLIGLLQNLNHHERPRFDEIYGFDISWSRVKTAQEFSRRQGYPSIQFFTGDLFHIPLADNYCDLVFTVAAIQTNGGKEKEILQELYRVCKGYLIFVESCYELAGEEARQRMKKHGYMTKLWESARELGYHMETCELYGTNVNELDPMGLTIIRKDPADSGLSVHRPAQSPYVCPISRQPLKNFGDSFYCPDSMLAYPIIQGIPCLLPGNAVVATKYESGFPYEENVRQENGRQG